MTQNFVAPYGENSFSSSRSNHIFDFLPVSVQILHDTRISNTHWHDYLQIWYTVSGEYDHTINGVTIPQCAGSAMLVFPYMMHRIDASKTDISNTRVIQISIRKDELEKQHIPYLTQSYKSGFFDLFYLNPHIVLSGKTKDIADMLCEDIVSEYQNNLAMHTNKIMAYIARFLELCTNTSERIASKRELTTTRTKNECLGNSLTYLYDNISKKVTIDDLSNAAMMSRRTFTSSFNFTIGQTCNNYITYMRMSTAIKMLKQTRKSIAEIAEECGFFDSSHFAAKCNELYGETPLSIRRNLSKWMREYGDDIFKKQREGLRWVYIFDDADMEKHQISLSFY